MSQWKVLVCYRECRHSMRPTMRGPGQMTQLPLTRIGVTTPMLSPCGPSLLGIPEPPLCPSWPTSAQMIRCPHDRSEHLFGSALWSEMGFIICHCSKYFIFSIAICFASRRTRYVKRHVKMFRSFVLAKRVSVCIGNLVTPSSGSSTAMMTPSFSLRAP